MLILAAALLNMEEAAIHNTFKNLKHNTNLILKKRNISLKLN